MKAKGKKKKEKHAGIKTSTCIESNGKLTKGNETKLDNSFNNSKNSDQNYSIAESYNDLINSVNIEESRFEYLKEKLNELQQNKVLLQSKINNNDKTLSLLRGVKTSYDESTDNMELKLNKLKKDTQIKQCEYNQLVEETKKIEKGLEEDLIKKKVIEEEFNEWSNDKFEINAEISQERMQILKKRKDKNKHLKQLLSLIKQRNNRNYDVNYLKALEKKLNNEITNYKNYKTDDVKLAMKQLNIDLT